MKTNERAVAEKLLQTGAIKLQPQQPFTWASGWKSPIYCDNRRVLGHPYVRDFIKSELCNAIFEQAPDAAGLAGVATAGIAWAAMAADQLKLPMCYVRPKPKEHGMGNQVEGFIESGSELVVIEDLVSTGKSSLQAVAALRSHGYVVKQMICLFTYGFPEADRQFEDAGVSLIRLTSYQHLVELAESRQMFAQDELELLNNWRSNPAEWGSSVL